MRITINQEIKNIYQDDYPAWLNSRKQYAPAIPIGILASMQPSKSGIERDYPLSPLLSFLNAQIMLQKELLGNESFRAFILVYYRSDATRYYKSIESNIVNVKQHAGHLNVSYNTIYDMAHKFALTVYNQAVSALATSNKINELFAHKAQIA